MKKTLKSTGMMAGTLFLVILILSSCKKETVTPAPVVVYVTTPPTPTPTTTIKNEYTFYKPTGIAQDVSIGWKYVDFTAVAGKQIDSVCAYFYRPNYPAGSQELDICASNNSFLDKNNYYQLNDYSSIYTSMYNKWYKLNAKGLITIRVSCPSNVVWDSLKIVSH